MPLPIPSSPNEVITKLTNNVKRELPESRPQDRRTMIRAVTSSFGYSIFDIYSAVDYGVRQCFPQTAEDEYLKQWGDLNSIFQLPASGSVGYINATGVAGTTITSGSTLKTSDADFLVSEDSTISSEVLPVNVSVVSNVATAISSGRHNLSDNVQVTISGATPSELNGTFDISVSSVNSFTYQTTAADGAGSGSIVAEFDRALILIESNDSISGNVGVKTNVPFGDEISFDPVITDVDQSAFPDFDAITGGSEQETTEKWRKRILFAEQNPVANFNKSAITQKCTEINGVTRVFVREITPDVGQVTVYFTRDNDDTITPSPAQRAIVRNNVLEILPLTSSETDVLFPELDGVNIDFQFSELIPDSSTMREAISNNLQDFFRGNTFEGVDLDEDLYRSAISQSVSSAGEAVQSFALNFPSGDITISDGEIAILGDVTYV